MRGSGGKIAVLIVIAVAFLLHSISSQLDDYAVYVMMFIGINIILAVSLNLVTGYTGQFSLGHAGFMAVGAYTTVAITNALGPRFAENLLTQAGALIPALLAGGVVAALAGLVVGIPSLRVRGDYLAIVTLGFGEIIRVLLQNWDSMGAARGLSVVPAYANLFWVFSAAAITVYVILSLVNSTYGRGFLATRDDEVAAEAMGVNTTRYKVLAFVLGAFFAGIAGGLYGHTTAYINPDGFGFLMSVEILIMVIVGGMGNTIGAVAAAVVLTLINEKLRDFETARMIIFSLMLIIIMILRPQGLLGNIDFVALVRRLFRKGGAAAS